MSKANVEIVRGLLADFMGTDLVLIFRDEARRRGLVEAIEPMLDPEAEFCASARGMPALDGQYRGRQAVLDGIVSTWSEALTAWETFVFEIEETRELGDGRILVLTRSRGRSKGAGVEIEGQHGNIYTVRNGKLTRIEQYMDRSEALEAAGLAN
ncbi:MAG: nuclear transport factor 2 family protein [Solirubrobacterales bacterium]